MGDILSNKQLDDEAKAILYNQVLQRYLTYYDQRKGQPLHVKLTTPKPVETPKPEDSSEETSTESSAEAEIIPDFSSRARSHKERTQTLQDRSKTTIGQNQ